MNDDYINEQFRIVAFNETVNDAEVLIDRVLSLEAQSRHEMACNGDPVAAAQLADEAYAVFTETPLRSLPTFVMNIADRFNREHEAYTKTLDDVSDALEHLRQAVALAIRRDTVLAWASVASAQEILTESLEHALYEKDEPS